MFTIKQFSIRDLHSNNLQEAMTLLELYGRYMYEELGLTAGKVNFDDELKGTQLLKKYQTPTGSFILAYADKKAVGCVALKKWEEKACEMKRMFVLPEYRGLGLGKLLAETAFHKARQLGFNEILLDTNQEMATAIALYRKLGFVETEPYCYNENEHVVYMKKTLAL